MQFHCWTPPVEVCWHTGAVSTKPASKITEERLAVNTKGEKKNSVRALRLRLKLWLLYVMSKKRMNRDRKVVQTYPSSSRPLVSGSTSLSAPWLLSDKYQKTKCAERKFWRRNAGILDKKIMTVTFFATGQCCWSTCVPLRTVHEGPEAGLKSSRNSSAPGLGSVVRSLPPG